MGIADGKAALAKAYATGRTPTFVSQAPNGRDELWAIDDFAFVVPVVPEDAPLPLQYALRLRRDALLTGSCEDCGAAVGVDWTHNFSAVPFLGAPINHRGNCAGADHNAGPKLQKYYRQVGEEALESAFADASRRTREQVSLALQDGIKIENQNFRKWAEGLLDDRLESQLVSRCPHLVGEPFQTWHLLLGDDLWRCDRCEAILNHTIAQGDFRLPLIEDNSCDRCRRFSPNLESSVLAN